MKKIISAPLLQIHAHVRRRPVDPFEQIRMVKTAMLIEEVKAMRAAEDRMYVDAVAEALEEEFCRA